MSVETKVISKEISELMWKDGRTLSTAESCTAGNIAAAITAIPGSSQYYKGGVVAYANQVKENLLRVNVDTIETYGVVSEETVCEMVKGAMETLNTDYAIATSGIAGPGGGTHELPVGTIWIAVGSRNKIVTMKLEGDEGRDQNIARATSSALHLMCDLLKEEQNPDE
ncbi:MAG: CinA family protein [Bacteroidaceae bacterium]|nr:CinA family protein [Bacteroidaceae bacterium]